MKIKRFHARTMREAMRLVREEQGADAVILSNQRSAGGVEVVAAVDYDAALVQQTLRAHARSAGLEAEAPAAPAALAPQAQTLAAAPAAVPQPPVGEGTAESATGAEGPDKLEMAGKADRAEPEALARLQSDMSGLRQMLEQQMAGLLWDGMQRKRPRQAAALRALAGLGLESEHARAIAQELPEVLDEQRARFLPLGLLAKRIPVDAQDPVLAGGVIALVGPTGVGKTTTVAKLAARFAAVHGTRDIALVTTDHYRIGAQEQLYTYGRLLGVPVHAVGPGDELETVLARLADRRLVLIDSAGLSPRDKSLSAQLEVLKRLGTQVRSYLVLAANAQQQALDETLRKYSALDLSGCILSKLDEAARIGGALSLAIRRQLRIAYFADGQRVPEDLHVARADRLVIRATQLVRELPIAEDPDFVPHFFAASSHAHA
jgi:flagellar biosynthesis protein FlhF